MLLLLHQLDSFPQLVASIPVVINCEIITPKIKHDINITAVNQNTTIANISTQIAIAPIETITENINISNITIYSKVDTNVVNANCNISLISPIIENTISTTSKPANFTIYIISPVIVSIVNAFTNPATEQITVANTINSIKQKTFCANTNYNIISPTIVIGNVYANTIAPIINTNIAVSKHSVGINTIPSTIYSTANIAAITPSLSTRVIDIPNYYTANIASPSIYSHVWANTNVPVIDTTNISTAKIAVSINSIPSVTSYSINISALTPLLTTFVTDILNYYIQVKSPLVYCHAWTNTDPCTFNLDGNIISPKIEFGTNTNPVVGNIDNAVITTEQISHTQRGMLTIQFGNVLIHNYKANCNTEYIPVIYVKIKQNNEYEKVKISNIPVVNQKGKMSGV